MNSSALTSVTATGAGAVGITSGANAINVNSVFDASAVTGAVTLNFAAGTTNGVSLRGGSGIDTITGNNIVGKGNILSGGAGKDVITFGSNAAGVINGLVYKAAGETFQGTIISGTTQLTAADVITGLGSGDTIDLTALTPNSFTLGALGTTLASADGGTIALVKGNYNATSGIFTVNASGTDSVLRWDAEGTDVNTVIETIVLVGFAGSGSTTNDGLITLA